MLLPRLGLSQHFGQDVLGLDIGFGSVLPQWPTTAAEGEDRKRVRRGSQIGKEGCERSKKILFKVCAGQGP